MDGDVTAAIGPVLAVLGWDGFVLLAAGVVGGELELLVETTETVTGCPTCGLVATAHGRREHLVRDAPLAGLPVAIMWAKRVWRCADPVCPKKTWSEQHPAIAPRRLPTHGLTAPDSCGVRGARPPLGCQPSRHGARIDRARQGLPALLAQLE